MTDFKEDAYILEKMEISEDEDQDYEYKEIIDDGLLKDESEEEDDLDNFEALKTKTEKKLEAETMGDKKPELKPKVVERDVVIDDFIRNFLQKFNMSKTMNIFQQEWYELQKKGVFHDNQIGLITDIGNKNHKMADKIQRMEVELKQAKIIADQAKSTWEKLRKERDFHKTHQNRVNGEKVTITNNIKKIKDLHDNYEEKIEEIKKKLQSTVKEKALLKLEKDKLQKKANDIAAQIKQNEERAQKEIEQGTKRQQQFQASLMPIKGKNTPYPEDARPNPYLSKEYENLNQRAGVAKKIEAGQQGIGGIALHMRKQIIASAGDDCSWKIWNMENGENIMTGEGHKDWIAAIDFHPAGSHLATAGGDKSIKIWDFQNSSIAHTFADVHTGPVWNVRFHDTGDFIVSSSGDGSIKLFDLNSLKQRQQYRSHTDSVNGLHFQPFTNFFVSGSADRTLSIWDMRTGLTVQTFYGHLNAINDTKFSIGGQYIASCDSDGIVKAWDIRMVQEICTIDTGDAICTGLDFDKTSKNIFVACSDAEIKMINVEKQEIVNVLKGHDDAVNKVIVNQENTCVYSASSDGTIRTWK